MCLQELVQVKQFWELKGILQKGLGGIEQILRPSVGGAPLGREVCLGLFQLYWRLVLLQVTQVGGAGEGFECGCGRRRGLGMGQGIVDC